MNYKTLKQKWLQEEKCAFSGWDFSHIEGRWSNEELPWDYKKLILEYLEPSDNLLDMGTGGGEFLLSLNHPYNKTSVTEAYLPNVKLCREKLSPLGVNVAQVYDDNLPFEDNYFDIIINRHESFKIAEIQRTLRKDKLFITQQVGGNNNVDLAKRLIDKYEPLYKDNTLENNISSLIKAGFEIVYSGESDVPLKFYDIGALVYFAKIIEWEFPGFSVETHFDKLVELQKELDNKGYIQSTEQRFIVVARKKN